MMRVLISKSRDVFLANPVLFRITPLTVDEAFEQGLITNERIQVFIPDYPTQNDIFSPLEADQNDFNTTIFEVTFGVDEGLASPNADIPAPIAITEDEVDEAQSQYFVAYLEIIDAVNFGLITVTRQATICTIVDNDGIQIGFAQPSYAFPEPLFETLITEVKLIREGNRQSEQTFVVVVEIGDPSGTTHAATRETLVNNGDYRVGIPGQDFVQLLFTPSEQNITLQFILNPDELPEGLEAFRASSFPSTDTQFPTFQPPRTGGAFQSTEIQILDSGLITVGFEQLSYTVSETDGQQEVCVQVFNPPQDAELVFALFLVYETNTGTADGSDFVEVGPFTGFLIFTASIDGERRQCFNIIITDDMMNEDAESFTVLLKLEPFLSPPSGILVQPDLTEIVILDDDDGPVTTAIVTDAMTTTTGDPSTVSTADAMTTTEQIGNLFFEFNGQQYPSGSSLLITDIGERSSSSIIDLGSALACVTSEVNTQCCRRRDGGNVGEWFFPAGSMVPRNQGNRNADFTRSGFTHQVRLNRRNNAFGPVGTYTCRVPDATDSSVIHTATITLEMFHPRPRTVLCFEVVCVWQGPAEGSLEDYAGYDIRFGGELVFKHENDEFFHVVDGDPRILALGAPQDVTVEVRVSSNGDVENPWSDPVPLSSM